jgi:hypothetical protein
MAYPGPGRSNTESALRAAGEDSPAPPLRVQKPELRRPEPPEIGARKQGQNATPPENPDRHSGSRVEASGDRRSAHRPEGGPTSRRARPATRRLLAWDAPAPGHRPCDTDMACIDCVSTPIGFQACREDQIRSRRSSPLSRCPQPGNRHNWRGSGPAHRPTRIRGPAPPPRAAFSHSSSLGRLTRHPASRTNRAASVPSSSGAVASTPFSHSQ